MSDDEGTAAKAKRIADLISALVAEGFDESRIRSAAAGFKKTFPLLSDHQRKPLALIPTTAASHPFLRPEAQKYALQLLSERSFFDQKRAWTQTTLIKLLNDFVQQKWPGTSSRAPSRDHEAASQIYRHWMESAQS